MRALWIVALLAGCEREGRHLSVADAGDGPLSYELSAFWLSPPGQPQVQPRPVIYIDGLAAASRTFEYASGAEALAAEHVIELRQGDLVVFTATSTMTERSCLHQVDRPIRGSESWCAYASGELRVAGDQADSADGRSCLGDAFCRPRCFPSGGCPGERCTSIYASVDPIATHLGCAPIGDKTLGEACTVISDEAGMHDDCGEHLLCVDGTCRQTCSVHDLPSAECATYSYAYGHAPELGICG